MVLLHLGGEAWQKHPDKNGFFVLCSEKRREGREGERVVVHGRDPPVQKMTMMIA